MMQTPAIKWFTTESEPEAFTLKCDRCGDTLGTFTGNLAVPNALQAAQAHLQDKHIEELS